MMEDSDTYLMILERRSAPVDVESGRFYCYDV